MSFISMSVTGIRAYIAKLAAAAVATEAMQPSALQKAAYIVERRAKQIVVEKDIIDTGNLLGLIAAQEPVGDSIEIVAQAPYSIFPEYGTIYQTARPYMRPALDETQPEVEKLIGDLFVRTVYGVMAGGGKWTKTVR